MSDITRQLKWGNVIEVFGEMPKIGWSEMALLKE